MLISHNRPASLHYLPPLTLDCTSLEQVSSFKYLGVTLSSTLSWSTHISLTCSKAKKQIGYIYRHFYAHSSPQSLLKLYMSIVLPVLSYCSSVWDPHTLSDISKLEKVQHFALKMCSKNWSADYHSLLSTFNIPCLSSHRSISKLILLHKFIFKQMYIPENVFSFHHQLSHNLRSCHPLNLDCPLSQTSAAQHSFFPSSIRLWNSLPSIAKSFNTTDELKSYLSTLYHPNNYL